MDDAILKRLTHIESALRRMREVYTTSAEQFESDYTSQDSVIMNLQRACEASIDVANIVNKQQGNGIPQSSRDSFELLKKAGVIEAPLALGLQKMVGLRNIAVHDYQTLNLDIVKHVIEHKLVDFETFVSVMKRLK